MKKLIIKIQNLPQIARIAVFIVVITIWFLIARKINSNYVNDIKRAENLRTLWILSSLILAGLWVILFPGNKKVNNK